MGRPKSADNLKQISTNIKLKIDQRKHLDNMLASGKIASISQYIRDLIDNDIKRRK